MILSALALFPLAMAAPSRRLPRQNQADVTPFADQLFKAPSFNAATPPFDASKPLGAPPATAPQSEPRQDSEKKPKQPSTTPKAPTAPKIPATPKAPAASKTPADPKSAAASCDLSKTEQPASALQQPTPDMNLVLIAIGHGTQNYTCANATAVPASIGAVAQLFNTTCSQSSQTKSDALGSIQESTSASAAIGAHFFLDNTTPDFDIKGLGNTEAAKLQDTPAPNPAKDVKWLRLGPKAGSTSAVKAIYRLNTQGGVAPATCEGKKAGEVLAVEYQAQYWFYT